MLLLATIIIIGTVYKMNKKMVIVLLVFSILFITTQKAHAYINPGTGSDFIQMITGFFALIGYSIKKMFGLIPKSENDDE